MAGFYRATNRIASPGAIGIGLGKWIFDGIPEGNSSTKPEHSRGAKRDYVHSCDGIRGD